MVMRKQGCKSMRMRAFIVFYTAAVLLLLGEQCEAFQIQDRLYHGAEIVCQDKLAEWRNSSTAGGDEGASSPGDSSSWAGVTMRGKWKPVSSSSSIVRPSFVNSDQGKFDFTFPSFRTMGAEGVPIVNVSGFMYFWTDKHRHSLPGSVLEVSGVYYSESGELCFVGCVQQQHYRGWTGKNPNSTSTNLTDVEHSSRGSDETCIVRGQMTVAPKSKSGLRTATGTLESLITNSSEAGYFTSISVEGKVVDKEAQKRLFRWDVFVRSAIFAVEAVLVMWQIFTSIRSAESYFVSMLMIVVQIVAMTILSFYLIYVPWRLLTFKRFKYLLSTLTLVPWLILTVIILLNVVFLLVILRKRFVAKRLSVVERPQEVLLAIVCSVIYAITGVVVWSTHNFDAYVQVVWCWFLLPQVIANVFWDLRLKPLHPVYVVGISLCRISSIGFQAVRPTIYGFDDLTDFPHGWFWGMTGTVLFFGTYTLLQQRYGGRCYLPQRWFGYKQLPTSRSQANEDQSYAKDEDTMLEL